MGILPLVIVAAVGAVISRVVFDVVVILFFDKLARFPGPPLAKWTSLSYLWEMWKDRNDETMLRLHAKYGPVVRVGPNKLYFSQSTSGHEIYGSSSNFSKSEMYGTNAPTAYGEPVVNFFATQDLRYHDRIRKVATQPFTLVQKHEKRVDLIVDDLLQVMRDRFADAQGEAGIIDMGKWCTYFALDAVSKIVYDQEYGFIKSDTDMHGLTKLTEFFMSYVQYVGAAPWIDRLLVKNPIILWLQKQGWITSESAVVKIALRLQNDRLQSIKDRSAHVSVHADMLDDFIRISGDKPDILNDFEIMKLGIAVVLAGGDTTGSLLTSMFYFLVTNQVVLRKLTEEVDAAQPRPSYSEARKLEYLDACILETKRMNPVARFTPERVVPQQGSTIGGEQVPGGTTVGANGYVLSRNRDIYGDDVHVFRPGRWLNTEPDQRRIMERMLPIFGFGKHECMGKHIVAMENMKFWPAFLREFAIDNANPLEPMRMSDSQITRPTNVRIRISRRNQVN